MDVARMSGSVRIAGPASSPSPGPSSPGQKSAEHHQDYGDEACLLRSDSNGGLEYQLHTALMTSQRHSPGFESQPS